MFPVLETGLLVFIVTQCQFVQLCACRTISGRVGPMAVSVGDRSD
jgi:hypothetical protein